ncbi:MAG: acyltransferase [Bacilli bacterium]|nr:acyltransferase [Bacilli bacterium]
MENSQMATPTQEEKSEIRNKKIRNSAFELLRVIAIIFIIISHYCFHGARNDPNILPYNMIIACNLSLGNIGVAIFMMISGYFLRKSQKVNVMHMVKLILEYYFYIILGYGLSFALVPGKTFDSNEFLRVIFPLFFEESWFVPAYLLVYLFHPFINKIFTESNYKSAFTFIVLITVVWSIVPTFTTAQFFLNGFISVFCFYCYGAFLKLAQDVGKKWYNKKTAWRLFFIGLGVILLYQTIVTIIACYNIDTAPAAEGFTTRFSFLMILMVMGLIMLVSLSKPFYCRPLNFVAGFTLGIYLIHDNIFLRDYYWHTLFRTQDFTSTNLMIPHLLMCLAIIFCLGLVIDVTRKYALEGPLFKLINRVVDKIKVKIELRKQNKASQE